jgi:uridine kinase
VIGIDGRSGSGKSTLAGALAEHRSDLAVVHTDDVAWHHSFFDWDGLLVEGILTPLRRNKPPVAFRPAAWSLRNRPGCIHVPPDTRVVIIEGVGACREGLQQWYDATVWVQTDPDLAYRRVVARNADPPQFTDDWTAAEIAFLSADRPWDRTDVVVSGQPQPPRPNHVLAHRRVKGHEARTG